MQVMTVSAFLAYVNETFRAIWDSNEVAIEGEVSGYRVSQGQWAGFDLKDAGGLVNIFCPLWKIDIPLTDGAKVRVFGLPRVYPKYGKFSFSADRIELTGEGGLRKALEALKQKLTAEGLFDPSRKRVLPRFPERVALIASRESAAYGDFIRVLKERWRGMEIDLYHVLVQGERAPEQIVQAIQKINETERVISRWGPREHADEVLPSRGNQDGRTRSVSYYDVLVLTRGGGSLEELSAFNDERVVRALHASFVPTLVGIGHERDLTLAEEAADVRASTPTDCARRLVPDCEEVFYEMATMSESMSASMEVWIREYRNMAEQALDAAGRWMKQVRLRGEQAEQRAIETGGRWLDTWKERVREAERLIASFDPGAIVRRGYALVRDADGRLRVSIQGLRAGSSLALEMRDGRLTTLVQSVQYGKKEV